MPGEIFSIKYGLLFSRFMRSDAKDYPDIDYDVAEPMELKERLVHFKTLLEQEQQRTALAVEEKNTSILAATLF